jgi:hypothetical protein
MALYLSPWFALLASFGVQSALVLVAWLIGFNRTGRATLAVVYAITATISVAFSYVSLYTWFSAQERPALVQRRLYDELNVVTDKAQERLSAAVAEAQKHVLALDEMTAAEKSHGYISRAADADPYLAHVRQSVAHEAETYGSAYSEGSGPGLRYTAFDRYGKIARQSLDRLQQAQRALTDMRGALRPLDATEGQLRVFRPVYESIPWDDVREALHAPAFDVPAPPAYSDFVDRSATRQEDLMLAFTGLFTAPTGPHVFSLALAAFIDVIVFLLAFASGPFFFGAPEQRWFAAAAAVDAVDEQVFVRGLARKLTASPQGLARVDDEALTPGERQLVVLLAAKKLAAPAAEEGRRYYLLDAGLHQRMVESLSVRGLPLQAAPQSEQA